MQQSAILETEQWIERIVIGQNFCPFAAREVRKKAVRYIVLEKNDISLWLDTLLLECQFLVENPNISTTLILLPTGLKDFEDYLDVLYLAEDLLIEHDYEGVFQLASFHPDYQFGDLEIEDLGNFTNRSPYPMLHILREDMMEQALEHYPNPEQIPERNRALARSLGLGFFRTSL